MAHPRQPRPRSSNKTHRGRLSWRPLSLHTASIIFDQAASRARDCRSTCRRSWAPAASSPAATGRNCRGPRRFSGISGQRRELILSKVIIWLWTRQDLAWSLSRGTQARAEKRTGPCRHYSQLGDSCYVPRRLGNAVIAGVPALAFNSHRPPPQRFRRCRDLLSLYWNTGCLGTLSPHHRKARG